MKKRDYIIGTLIVVVGFSLALFVWNKSPGQLEIVASNWIQLQVRLLELDFNLAYLKSIDPGLKPRVEAEVQKMERVIPRAIIIKYLDEHTETVVYPLAALIPSSVWWKMPKDGNGLVPEEVIREFIYNRYLLNERQ